VTRALLAALPLLATACLAWPVSPRDVPGTYVMNRGRAADTLIVLPQGRYRRAYHLPGQPAVVDSGAWAINGSRRPMVVTFFGMWMRWRSETEASTLLRSPLVPAVWSMEPTRTFNGRMKFLVDEDLDWAYVRRR
jgi:hypothetical protein